jgi:hypothetical protein
VSAILITFLRWPGSAVIWKIAYAFGAVARSLSAAIGQTRSKLMCIYPNTSSTLPGSTPAAAPRWKEPGYREHSEGRAFINTIYVLGVSFGQGIFSQS